MRLITATLVVAIAGLAGAAFASAPAPSGFPRDANALRTLDAQQLRIVRRAGAQCWHAGQGGFRSQGVLARGCIINATEGMIASLQDPVLKSFHEALPIHARYDEYRPAFFWQRLVEPEGAHRNDR